MGYLIDTHCHLDFEDFDADRNAIVERAYNGGVKKIINIGCDPRGIKKTVEISKKYDFIFSAIGLHPQEAESGDENFFLGLEERLKEPKVVAIGECGLEYKIQNSKSETDMQEKQKEVFLKQLELVQKFDKPVIIHCRNAYPEILEILRREKRKNPRLRGVFHFFTGRLSQARELFEMGFLISFTGIITYARDYDKVVKNVPLEKIITETDAPFVAPEPYRGKRNEPFYVRYVVEKIAELKKLSFEEVAQETAKNAENLFGI